MPLVEAVIAKADTFDNSIFTTGTVLAGNEVELHSEISGLITGIFFEEGTKVSKGQLLVKLNDADLQAAMLKLKQQLSLAEKKEYRQKKLLDAAGLSQEEYDNTLNNLEIIKADIKLLEAQINKTEVKAPFDGQIGLRNIDKGAYISPAVSIATLFDADPVRIDFSIPGKYSSLVSKGDNIEFSIQNSSNTFIAKVYAVQPGIDFNTRTLQLRAIADNNEAIIIPGSFANIKLILKKNNSAVMVPTQAIIPVLKGQIVYIYKNGIAEPVDVETGERTDTKINILKGINIGDTVICSGLMQLKPKDKVKIIRYINQQTTVNKS